MAEVKDTQKAASERLRKGEMTTDELATILQTMPGCKVQIGRNLLLIHTKDGNLKSITQLLTNS